MEDAWREAAERISSLKMSFHITEEIPYIAVFIA
jgi:hypothetical protein